MRKAQEEAMEIRKTQQAVSVSKVEENQKADVTKAKPIGQNQTPDSFQIGSSRTSDNAGNGSASAEPEKKAGQITGGILIKQMTAARLGESGIKSPESKQSKEQTGTRELSQREQEIAEERAPVTDKTPEQSGGMTGDARTRIENSHDAVMQQMTDLYGTPRGGGGQSASSGSSGGGGTGSVGGGPGRATSEQRAQFEEMMGGNQGPQSGASKLAEMEAKMAGGGMSGLAQRNDIAQALFDSVGVQDTSSSSGPDKGMISQGAGYGGFVGYDESEGLRDNGKGQMAKEYPGLAKAAKSTYIDGGLTSPRKEALDQAEKEQDSTTPTTTPTTEKKEDLKSQGTLPDGTHVKTGSDGTSVITKTDGSQTVMMADGSRTEIHPDGSYEDYDSKGKKTGSGPALKIPAPDEENKGNREAAGLPDLNLPKAPKIQGDKDPTEDAVANDAAGTELSFIAQQGEYGLVGQPNEDRQVGGSGNVSTGGNIDYENQAGWGGREIEEDPSDVDVTPGANEELPPAANQPSEEESSSSKRLITSQPIAAQKEDLSRIKLEK